MFIRHFILFLLPILCHSQTATFYADSTDLYHMTGMRKEIHERITQAEWKIKGKTLRYGSKPVKVTVDNKIDTIFFRQNNNAKWDTLICNINKPETFKFLYNTCCGGFNVQKSSRNIWGKVKFSLIGQNKNDTYIGILDDAAVILSGLDTELAPYCRSAMHPNIYRVAIQKIEICQESDGCSEKCINNKGDIISFLPVSEKVRFLYLPLSEEPFVIKYDLSTSKVIIDYR